MSCVFTFSVTDGVAALRRTAEAMIATGAILRKRGIGDPFVSAVTNIAKRIPREWTFPDANPSFWILKQSPILDESIHGTLLRMDYGQLEK
jgi:hypothetical protein